MDCARSVYGTLTLVSHYGAPLLRLTVSPVQSVTSNLIDIRKLLAALGWQWAPYRLGLFAGGYV